MSHLANCILLAQLIAALMYYPCTVALLGFADYVKSRLRQWDPWGHWMGGMGLIFTPVLVRRVLRPSSRVWAYD